jgi:hypothetical protein
MYDKIAGVSVQALSSVNITLDASDLPKPFRVDAIRIPDEVAGHFLVTDVKVGKNSQLLTVGAVPAAVFSESSRVLQPELDVLHEGDSLTLSVTCASIEDQVFSAEVLGHQVQPGEALLRARRRMVLGLGRTLVQPGQWARIDVQPQCPFRPDGLVVPTKVAKHFKIVDFKVGKNTQSQLFDGLAPWGVSVSAEHFAENSERPVVRMDQAQVSMLVAVAVENISDRPQYFQGAVAGEGYWYWEDHLGNVVPSWTPSERMLVATRLLTEIQVDLEAGKYASVGGTTVFDVVRVLNAPAEVLDGYRARFAAVMTGQRPGEVTEPNGPQDKNDVFDS